MIGSTMTAVPAPPVPVLPDEWELNVTIGSAARPGGDDDDADDNSAVPCDTSDGCSSSCDSACVSS